VAVVSVVGVFDPSSGVNLERLWLVDLLMLSGLFAILQATVGDRLPFDPFSFPRDDLATPEVDSARVRLSVLLW
jgi:hypothetical protein